MKYIKNLGYKNIVYIALSAILVAIILVVYSNSSNILNFRNNVYLALIIFASVSVFDLAVNLLITKNTKQLINLNNLFVSVFFILNTILALLLFKGSYEAVVILSSLTLILVIYVLGFSLLELIFVYLVFLISAILTLNNLSLAFFITPVVILLIVESNKIKDIFIKQVNSKNAKNNIISETVTKKTSKTNKTKVKKNKSNKRRK